MLVSKPEPTPWLHTCFYGPGGVGKTKVAADFHNAGQHVVVVADYPYDMTLDLEGVKCPIITPRNEAEMRAIVEQPEDVIEKVIHPIWEDYTPKTFVFDIFKDLQTILMGHFKRQPIEVFEGAMTLDGREGAGLLETVPDEKADWKQWMSLDRKGRALVKAIGHMPYHTIVTLHAVEEYDAKTKLQLTGDPRKDKDIAKSVGGYVNILGDKLKHELGYLASDFFAYLESNGSRYTMYPKPAKGFYARTRMAKYLPAQMDWTDKSMYDILWGKYQEAKKKAEEARK